MRFLNATGFPIGLDISDRSIKLVQLKKKRDKLKIQAWGKVDLPPGLLENGEIKNQKELAKTIRKLVSHPDHGKVTVNEAAICLPEGKTFLKVIEVEKETGDDKKAVEDELQKHIPLPLEELYCDWQIIGDSGHSNLVLIGAAPRKIIDAQLDLLRDARLSVSAVEAESEAVCRCLLAEENPKYRGEAKSNYAIIDVGGTDASLAVYSKKSIIFSVSLPVTGEEITAKISQALNVDHEQANKLKIIYGSSEKNDQPAIKKIIAQMADELAVKSKEAINFFSHHFSSWGPVEKILLCGGGANLKDLDKMIQAETGIATSRGDAFINFQKDQKNLNNKFKKTFGLNTDFLGTDAKGKDQTKQSKTVKYSHDISLSFVTAIGLALRGIFIDE